MASREATRSNGSRYRMQHERTNYHIREHDSAPEWGNRFTCVACWEHGITDLARHRSNSCEDWNALNKINCGFQRQWQEGRAPLGAMGQYPAKAFCLTGEHYRLVKGRFGILPHHIVRWQNENWGPYETLVAPPEVHVVWRNISYWTLLQNTINSLPSSMAVIPQQCTCSRALMRSLNGTTHSYHHEKNALDELNAQKAVGLFVDSHMFLRGQLQHIYGFGWQTTQPFLARVAPQPLNGTGNWIDLAPVGGFGVAGVGDRGIAQTNVDHYNMYHTDVAAGNVSQRMNLYQGKTVQDAQRGQFTMPGTPRH